jgi:hypothetical protein
LRPVGFRLEFGADRTFVSTVDLASIDDLASGLDLWYRIKRVLQDGPPKTIVELADELNAQPDSIKKAVSRKSKGSNPVFTRIPTTDGSSRIALVERRYAS